jgi:hypothetical protein
MVEVSEDQDYRSEEFDCPPGRVTVDIVDTEGHQGRGIHIYYFDPALGDSDQISHTILPSKKQWDHVKKEIAEWLDQNLE